MLASISLFVGFGVVGLWLVGLLVVLSLVYAYGDRQQRVQDDADPTIPDR